MQEVRRLAENLQSGDSASQANDASELLRRLRGDTDQIVRLEIVRALAQVRAPAAFEAMEIALSDPRPELRVLACEGLGENGGVASIPLLAKAIQSDGNLDVRIAATRSLGRFQSEEAVQALSMAVADSDPALQYVAVQSLRQAHSEDLGNNINAWRQFAKTISRDNSQIANRDSTESSF